MLRVPGPGCILPRRRRGKGTGRLLGHFQAVSRNTTKSCIYILFVSVFWRCCINRLVFVPVLGQSVRFAISSNNHREQQQLCNFKPDNF